MELKIILIYAGIAVLIAAGFIAFRILKKRYTRNVTLQKELVEQHKQTVTIFVIEKKMAKITEARLPKGVADQIPAIYKLKKMPLITAKVGPQIVTLICEDALYDQIPDKKNVTVEVAGIFIAGVKNQPAPRKKRR